MRSAIQETIRRLNSPDGQVRKDAILELRNGNEEILPALLGECEKRANLDDPLWKKAVFMFFSKSTAYHLAESERNRNDYNWRFRQASMILFRYYPNFVATNRKRILKFKRDLNDKVIKAVKKCLEVRGLSDDHIELND